MSVNVEHGALVDKIDDILPQTQCRQCTFAGCRPYAQAIANGEADINQCPPGGQATILALANLLDRDPKPLNPENGQEKPKLLAVIVEKDCIGCTLCIQACPVDAILGAAKQMHTVIAAECTGCELCLPPCPVDCIRLVPAVQHSSFSIESLVKKSEKEKSNTARKRHMFRLERLQREKAEREARLKQKKIALESDHAVYSLSHKVGEGFV